MSFSNVTKWVWGKCPFHWLRGDVTDQYGLWRKQLITLSLRPWLPIECSVLDDRRAYTASISEKSPSEAEMSHFLKVLVSAAEKSANIARACRYEDDLFQLLIQEKKSDEMNRRFFQDFKTLADVLIQETVRHDIGKEFPEIAEYIKGEENNTFTNTLGESITVEVKEYPGETSSMLCKVLDGNENAANLLAAEVHKEIHLNEDFSRLSDCPELPISQLGIWIDPIDSTAEYISGGCVQGMEGGSSKCSIPQSGLPCVTVLIGAFHRQTGTPVIGVVNRPFSTEDSITGMWTGKYYWGISYEGYRMSSIVPSVGPEDGEDHSTGGDAPQVTGMRMVQVSVEGGGEGGEVDRRAGGGGSRGIVVISGSESEALRSRLLSRYTVVEAAGAGHKQLCVALGDADAYLLTRPTTFRWDACGPHALLAALGGGVVDCRRVTRGETALPPSHLLECPGLMEALPSVLDLEMRFGLRYNCEGDESDGGRDEDCSGRAGSSISKWCNKGGIIAYRNPCFLLQLVGTMRQPAGAVTSPV